MNIYDGLTFTERIDKRREVHGYKVFHADWTCDPIPDVKKKYTCPGRFKEHGKAKLCGHGMHFCRELKDCFNYYSFNTDNRIAEVIGRGDVVVGKSKCCTTDLEIVREINWFEALEMLNDGGKMCTGKCNSGDFNTGDGNDGKRNTGCHNAGSSNAGNYNNGLFNTGNYNFGDLNSGNRNTGDHNCGNRNSGRANTGNHNTGNENTGNFNHGNHNVGDWNVASFTNGCFMTENDKTIRMFNKPSPWTLDDFRKSPACRLLNTMPKDSITGLLFKPEDDRRCIELHDGAYLCKKTAKDKDRQLWWDDLKDDDCLSILNLPNFDIDVFKDCTGIDVRERCKKLKLPANANCANYRAPFAVYDVRDEKYVGKNELDAILAQRGMPKGDNRLVVGTDGLAYVLTTFGTLMKLEQKRYTVKWRQNDGPNDCDI